MALLIRETGWPKEYVEETLDAAEVMELLEIYDAYDRARAWVRQREARKSRQGAGRR